MKKIATILCILLVVTNTIGVFIVFKISRHNAKLAMQSFITTNAGNTQKQSFTQLLSTFVFSKNDISNKKVNFFWQYGDNEFLYNNQLYDIVHTKSTNDSIKIIAISDKNEVDIINQFNSYLQKNLPKKSDTNKQLFSLLLTVFLPIQNSTNIFLINSRLIHVDAYKSNLVCLCKKVVVPPPKSC